MKLVEFQIISQYFIWPSLDQSKHSFISGQISPEIWPNSKEKTFYFILGQIRPKSEEKKLNLAKFRRKTIIFFQG